MKKVFLIITFCMALINAKEIEVNLLDFANLASENSKTDILLSDEIEPNNYYFYTSKNSDIKIGHFRKAIESKGLKLILTDDFYYVVPKNDENVTFTDKKLRYLPLENNSFNDISGIISARIDTNTTYISSTNSAVFMADDEEYSEILEFSKMADKKLEQVNFKLTILETNTNDYRDLGTHINSLGDLVTHSDLNYFINLITMPFTAETNIITNKKKGFYGVLSLLEQNGVTTIKQSPFLVAKSGKEVYFSSVENIPYLRNTSSYSNNGTTTQTTYDYKDVGLKIKIRPVVLENMVDFDLDLVVEDIVDNTTLTPRTSKKELKSNYSLKRGEILVLSGINKNVEYSKRNGIPLLKDIPILKYLFSIEQDYKSTNIITLTIEVN
ncbi:MULTISPECIES: type II secretion system protein GspD [unclassified Campylobacter]|uniref:type II secretion system protein GspD n=1 Tax=unclassified Campylobacter TaxID=2593542 RepID=UPI0022E9F874|nr:MULTISPECIES: type II and III secretion system protein [unclassified Campylobacter]MDA3056773.1 type II and III secretion system protein [Campylobacter sp. CN_NA1]MDA3065938.1 type II and III secretion system protein [Campylobacter sp. CN_NE4]MDA3069106.1 type II and III secretion system protein [Campylobacter sp. CN_NE3]MDA3083264.1 type II and III secretion system protein [Campylobacter sp. CN_EL2]MDA3084799.1 type II and III secretion system protein [Campylobacter sp. CN_NE1]